MTHLTTHPEHPAAAYDPRMLGYVDFAGPEETGSTGQTLIRQIFAYYQETLFCTPRALAFLSKLGVSDTGLLEQWQVGFVDRTLGKQLPSGETREGAWIRGSLQPKGLFVASGGEFFRGALVFPNVDGQGVIAEAYGERITPKLRSGTPYQLYWSDHHAGFYNQAALTRHRSILLCKNPLDGLILTAAGFSNVVATLGSRGFDVPQLDALAGGGVEQVTTAFDNTPEGTRASRLVSQALSFYGIACRRLVFEVGTGPKEHVCSHGAGSLESLFKDSRPCVQTYESLTEDGLW